MIPDWTLQTIKDYLENGFEPGSFVRAVLENNLSNAFACADIHNTAAMRHIVMYVYNKVPADAWGSRQVVEAYIERKREQKRNAQEKPNAEPVFGDD